MSMQPEVAAGLDQLIRDFARFCRMDEAQARRMVEETLAAFADEDAEEVTPRP